MYLLCGRMEIHFRRHIGSIALIATILFFSAPLEAQDISLDSILHKARTLRPQNLKKYYSYKSRFKERCKAHVQEVPFEVWPVSGVLIPAQKDTGLAYYSEALIDARYGGPQHYFQDVLIKREAGKVPIPNWQQLPAYDFNLLQKRIYLNEAFDRGFVSPLSEEGADIYLFELTSLNHEKQVARIAFAPRKEKFPAMTGFIDLHLASGLPLHAQFNISANNQLELLDSIAVVQNFKWEKGIYRAQDQQIEIYLNLFHFRGYYQVSLEYEQFRYREIWQKSEFDDLVFDLKSSEFNTDSSYWQSWKRSPQISKYLDSLQISPTRKQQFRSFGRSRLDPGPYRFYKNIFRGYTRRNENFFWDLPPLYKGLGFNPVEGLYWKGQSRIGYANSDHEISLRLQARMGTADQRFKPMAELSWQGDLSNPIQLSLEAGSDYRQFNEEEPILPVLSTIYNLVLARNYISLYGKDYLKLKYQSESLSGLTLGLDAEYAWRYPLFNRSSFSLVDADADYVSNNQGFAPNINPGGFKAHNSMRFDLSFSFQFGDRYERRYNQRFQDVLKGRRSLKVRSPKIYYDLKVGVPTFAAETDFIFQSLGIQHQFRWGNIGLSQFDISGGHFLRNRNVPFIDYRHFDGVQIFFLQPSTSRSARIKQFSTLPYYSYSTTDAYFELHYEHNFDGALLSNNNFLRRYKIHSLAGFNSLHLLNEKAFIEVFFGFDNIFKILRVELAGGLDNFNRLRPSLRVGFDFRYDYYQKNRR